VFSGPQTFTGDGSLLMNLGSLVTIAACGPANLSVVLIDNGVYEVTGGQKTPASDGHVDFAGFARSAGFATCGEFSELNAWQREAAGILAQEGPRFIWLKVEPIREDYLLWTSDRCGRRAFA